MDLEELHWEAVLARDERADGAFVYGVVTTGVFCRPSCPSRRPRRENVRFFSGPDAVTAAEAAGLRPCRRCDPTGHSPAARRAALVAEACRVIDASPTPPTLAVLAAALGLSPHHLHRVFTAELGVTPKAYADARRAARVRDALGEGAAVSSAVYDAGFGSNGRFYAASNDRLGMTPSAFRAGGTDVDVRFAVGECWLGSILVAATDRGVCAIELGDDPDALVRALQDRFHQARLVGNDPAFHELVARVIGMIDAPSSTEDLPLDVRGTAFQERVWQALRALPAGSTVTYSELAESIGAPRSVRAVAGACAANHVAVAIPCHRVVRTDGSLSGYRWGIDRKAALIARERADAS
ncbi:MAG: bifunctional DNA-binding transcriptional regulator/O6-methylguanine-DNA methyltransferase Ada [Acidimicrobiia bacterium]